MQSRMNRSISKLTFSLNKVFPKRLSKLSGVNARIIVAVPPVAVPRGRETSSSIMAGALALLLVGKDVFIVKESQIDMQKNRSWVRELL